ncbi:Leucine-rich_repeat-containing protein [Hexamita inflata]|uniref:Leucine-rich repeat-containing protein n=1 Tax=Hexamita inflata TaxID=28002 RepID=A0AA86TA85_9EUKA|nr:Leucine-rich repeat-containing protein [Hexamita inflata]
MSLIHLVKVIHIKFGQKKIDLKELNLIPTNVTHLTIRRCGLTSIQNIYKMVQLIELDLSYNGIKDDVSELGNLENLKILNIQDNQINHLRIEWQKLEELQFLNISNNEILFCEPLKDLNVNNFKELKCDNNKFVDLEFIIKMKNYKFDWLINYSSNNTKLATLKDFEEYLGPNRGTEEAAKLHKSSKAKQDKTNKFIDYIQQCNIIKLSNLVNSKSVTLDNEKFTNVQFTDILNITEITEIIVKNCQNKQIIIIQKIIYFIQLFTVNITSLTQHYFRAEVQG